MQYEVVFDFLNASIVISTFLKNPEIVIQK